MQWNSAFTAFYGFMLLVYLLLSFLFPTSREEEEDGVRWKPKPRDSSIEERKKILAELDTEVLTWLLV